MNDKEKSDKEYLSLVQKYENGLDDNGNEPDYDDYDDESEEREPDGYECSCCGNVQAEPGMGMGCDKCGLFNVMSEFYY